ncbi:MAG TPA: GNAT family N-acetyltransferase [Anaerolineae bacterium]|nr:GNAT family N-acetyltransferase [Anaerolineae bacterium]
MAYTYTEFEGAAGFLGSAREVLEREEAANSLMLGIALRLVDEPAYYGSRPYMAVVEAGSTLCGAAVMTPPFRLQVWAGAELDQVALGLVADGLLQGRWPVAGVIGCQAAAEAFAVAWRSRTGANWSAGMWMKLYELRHVEHPRYPPGHARPASAQDLDLVRRWAWAFHDACFDDDRHDRTVRGAQGSVESGRLMLWVDGEPCAMAARIRPTPHGEAVGLVYTPTEARRRGYASAVVAQVSQRILDDGKRFCTLYADLANPTSNSIYRSIGYRPVADVVEIDFGEG